MCLSWRTASLRTYTRKSGTTAVQVLWRDADSGKQRSFTYDDPREAEIAKRLIEAAGGRIASAAKLAAEIRSAARRRPLAWLLVASRLWWGESADPRGPRPAHHPRDGVGVESLEARRRRRRYERRPKSHRLNRAASLLPEVVPLLRPLTPMLRGDELQIVNETGDAIKGNTLGQEYLRSASSRAAISLDVHGETDDEARRFGKRPQVHDFGRTHASRMVEPGLDLLTLDHRSIATTTKAYGHLMSEIQHSATEAANRALRSRPQRGPTSERWEF